MTLSIARSAARSAVAALVLTFAPPALATAPVQSAPAVVAAPVLPTSTAEAGPALWVIRDADSTLYLFGSVHVLRPDTVWASAKIDAAFAASSDVWFEISNPDDQAAVIPLIQRRGVSPDRPLSSLLTVTEMGQLDAAARTIGSNISQMDPLRPWFAALTLSVAPLVSAGYDPASGVELVLKARAAAAGKPVRGFETIEHQVGLLADLPEPVQLDFLRSTLEDFAEASTLLDQMVAAWAAGDVETLNRVAVQDMQTQSPMLHDILLVRRNVDFANGIETLLAGSGTAFIAVGAAHLAGDDSVQSVLARRGVEVTRE